MTLANRIRNKVQAPLWLEQRRLINDQRRLIDYLLAEREQLRLQNLETLREKHGIVAGWLLSLEQPEADIRDDLWATLRALGEQVAVMEEHIVA